MSDQDDPRLPIKLDSTSNGEFHPRPLRPHERAARRAALDDADRAARRTGRSRRDFLRSACGAAATLLAFNRAQAFAGHSAGVFDLPEEAAFDEDLALERLDGREFIFDVQGHYLPPNLARTLKPQCREDHEFLSSDYMRCLGADGFIKDVFLDSDTDLMALSFVPSSRADEPLSIEEAHATRLMVDRLEGHHRLLLHGRCNPNQPGDMDFMDELVEQWRVSAFKCYTQYGPGGRGFYLDDQEFGRPFIEKARRLGVRNICVHKGIPFGRRSYEHSLCRDIGVVAKDYPDMNFLVYHSGYIIDEAEGPYDPTRGEGIDALVQTVLDNGLGPNSNVYAELGSTWRFLSLRDPDSAAHALGKLLRHVGEDNVLWGTDSVWYGSPQDQIQAFRAFQIAEPLREAHGYPELTSSLKAKILGLNACRPYGIDLEEVMRHAGPEASSPDPLALARAEYRADPQPHFRTLGPKTRREYMNLLRLTGGQIT